MYAAYYLLHLRDHRTSTSFRMIPIRVGTPIRNETVQNVAAAAVKNGRLEVGEIVDVFRFESISWSEYDRYMGTAA